ncbi:phosphonate ABC transporter substrate-binding protein [Salipaludibacillus neizhouensis]|uniref:Phosphonate ABC transporter substrate-binding protein n=1 Tax=Salipaludibacillus neizhouensis TaxID=885475 RepID=A0A3A9K232_9BACI|nr:phosphate/phosphite/phosphonate ABC transporter substrate-binding protein [Salipaludibacillus neizhouensis]RKL67194.1 phosphonate ABC transporter substrate-binding protein [Salipaludibacillus neizhouensis]
MKLITKGLITATLVAILAGCSENEEEQAGETFHVGVIPALSGDEFLEAVEELEGELDEALPQDVEIEVYPNYNGVVEGLNYGHIQMAYLGPRTYVSANDESGAEAIITQLIDGEASYYSYIITHADNPWDTLDEFLENVEERSFAFGSVSSTSGSLVPGKELSDRGVYTNEEEYEFDVVSFSGSHDITGEQVESNQVDAGAIDSAFYNSLIEQGTLDESETKVIWQSEALFQYPWSVSPDVDDETVELIKETFLNMDNEVVLEGFAATGFTEATDEDYQLIRDIMIEEGEIDAE